MKGGFHLQGRCSNREEKVKETTSISRNMDSLLLRLFSLPTSHILRFKSEMENVLNILVFLRRCLWSKERWKAQHCKIWTAHVFSSLQFPLMSNKDAQIFSNKPNIQCIVLIILIVLMFGKLHGQYGRRNPFKDQS